MEKAALEKYKNRLIELEDRLSGQVHRLVNGLPDEINAPGDLSKVPTHNADHDVEMFETDIELLRNEQDIHGKVHEALARIEQGTFGICERCGRPIAPARLDAIPYATHCKECAELNEKEAAAAAREQ
ncbi:MAG TPA: TraR/DksA C4-type zinc finger protein [Pirellulales bacterium]|nr:TraR/DksA C4-type zinc finger protein [Pirellulales bacterium]